LPNSIGSPAFRAWLNAKKPKSLFKISLLADFCDDFSPNAEAQRRVSEEYTQRALTKWRY
jgi:hypothetical protein